MLQDIRNTIKQSVIYGFSRVSTKLVGIVLLPLYAQNFSVGEYGVIVRIEALWQILWSIFLFGLESGVVRWFTQIESEERRKRFLFTVTCFLVVINLIFTAVLFVVSGALSQLIFDSSSYRNLVFYASLIASLEAVLFLVFLLVRINEKPVLYSILSVLGSLVNLLLQYYFIVWATMKIEGVFVAKIISPASIVLILLPYYSRFLRIGLEPTALRELIYYSVPLLLSSLISTLLNQSDRVILGYLRDAYNPNEVGLYGLAYNICGLANFLIVSPFALAFSVISWKKLSDANAKRFFTKSVTYLYLSVLYLILGISLFIPHFIKILGNQSYWNATSIVPWIAFSMPLYGILHIGVFSFYVTKKTKSILYFYIATYILNVTLNFFLIPYFNVYGAAASAYFSFLALNLLIHTFARKQYYFKYEWKKIFTMTACALVIIFFFFYFQMESRLLQVFLKAAAMIIFPFILYAFNFYEPIEIERIKGFVHKYVA